MKRAQLPLMLLALALGLLLAPGAGLAQQGDQKIPIATSWGLYRYQAGEQERLLAVLTVHPDEGWHIYSHTPGEVGRPTVLSAALAGRDDALQVIYPPGEPKPEPGDPETISEVYEGPTPLFVPLPAGAAEPFTIKGRLSMLLCTPKRCLPASEDLLFLGTGFTVDALPRAEEQPWWPLVAGTVLDGVDLAPAEEPAPPGKNGDLAPEYLRPSLEVSSLLPAVLLGLLAGLILNAMPCVLPVVTIKLNSLLSGSSEAGQARRRAMFREHNLFFALGVLAYFLILSGVLGLTGMGWGAIFQQPGVVMVLTAVVFGLSLSLLGVFDLPVVDLKFSQALRYSPRTQALFSGLLATLLATPCSGPFLGGVLGWALIQPPVVIAAVFAAIGMGMAAPYLLMAAFPGLVRFVPKPGAWTLYMEKAVGFFLLATCIYLLSILPERRLIESLALLWATGLAAWLWGVAGPGTTSAKRSSLRLAAALALAAGFVFALAPVQEHAVWRIYDQQAFNSEMGEKPVVVEFTADWCPTCKVLERTVLTPSLMERLQEKYGLELFQADLTEPNPDAQQLLDRLGSKSIPVVAVFPAGEGASRPLVLRDLFTASQLESALERTLETP